MKRISIDLSRPGVPTTPGSSWFPALHERMADTQPVITRDQAMSLAKRVLGMSSASSAWVHITHIVHSTTRLANDRIRDANSGDTLRIDIVVEIGDAMVVVGTNQLDDVSLQSMVARADAIRVQLMGGLDAKEQIHPLFWDEQDTYPETHLYQPSSVAALHSARTTAIPKILDVVRGRGFRTSGFVGVMARADAVMTNKGIRAYSQETDCEVTVTARPPDGKSSGWSGAAARDWSRIDPVAVATNAVEIAERGVHVQAVEPGRRTAILSPAAVAQLLRFFVYQFAGDASDGGARGFSKVHGMRRGSKFQERFFDPRVTITTDPTDPDGGFRPWFADGYVSAPTTWVDGGLLKYLAYDVRGALSHKKPYAEMPFGMRLHGGDTTIEEMIASCEDGIYVNRFSSVDSVDMLTGMITGVTRDGCFLVRHGKIDRPVKNFRFLTSPFFFLNNIVAMGKPERAAFGNTPWTDQEIFESALRGEDLEWPRRPMIVPPLMVRDFNFNALIDAV